METIGLILGLLCGILLAIQGAYHLFITEALPEVCILMMIVGTWLAYKCFANLKNNQTDE